MPVPAEGSTSGSSSDTPRRRGLTVPVLVTGASGYIASCTTRNEKKGEWMKQMYKDRGYDKFDYTVVTDLENVRSQR
jgi:hypothetical protein